MQKKEKYKGNIKGRKRKQKIVFHVPSPLEQITVRKLRKMDKTAFIADLKMSAASEESVSTVSGLVCEYNNCVKFALDKHAPLCTVRSRGGAKKPWYASRVNTKDRNALSLRNVL